MTDKYAICNPMVEVFEVMKKLWGLDTKDDEY